MQMDGRWIKSDYNQDNHDQNQDNADHDHDNVMLLMIPKTNKQAQQIKIFENYVRSIERQICVVHLWLQISISVP